MRFRLLAVILFLSQMLAAQYDAARYPVIPRPYKLLPFSGDFHLDAKTVIVTGKKEKFLRAEAELFRQKVAALYGIRLEFSQTSREDNVIFLSADSSGIPDEGYQLFINRNEISLYGGKAGIFYGLQTLLQLIHADAAGMPGDQERPKSQLATIPSCSIIDQPNFAWRGMHLDVARHFFPKENVKDYLRWMAMYKLNTFHWHLTDDQGWRIEIKKYPKLTQTGAWRNGTLIGHYTDSPVRYDSIRYGGFYTQDDIREIVRFADSLHITIVPEIEMPGHALAILAAYPELGCTAGPFEVAKTWGVFDDVLCPKPETFAFLENVLTEVAALFPGRYIHIGGDECPKTRWRQSEFCQNLMKEKKLKDENELQAWFTRQIVAMLQQKGKQAIGWDEILEGGLADGAAVMSWRGEEGGIAAAQAGHYVVMSPGGYCYFDHYQSSNPGEPLAIGGYLPLKKVYSYNPVPGALAADKRKYILGLQANLWTEYMGDWAKVQYMLFPRICALAEAGWSFTPENNYAFFRNRLLVHLDLLDRIKINYARTIFEVTGRISPTSHDAPGFILETEDPSLTIKYALDDEDDFTHSYDYPVIINKPMRLYAASFRNGKQAGRTVSWEFTYSLSTAKPISLRKAPSSSYNSGGAFNLVDGQKGTYPWKGSDWLGWSGDTLDATIDLGKDTLISQVEVTVLNDPSSWIWFPSTYSFWTSEDGIHFVQAQRSTLVPEMESGKEIHFAMPVTHARYVRIVIPAREKIPAGNPGEGNPAWLFVSEIDIR
jgi:hexosaminidase